jgi:hypothetical protein
VQEELDGVGPIGLDSDGDWSWLNPAQMHGAGRPRSGQKDSGKGPICHHCKGKGVERSESVACYNAPHEHLRQE